MVANIIIIAVIVVIALISLKSSIAHFKGEGGCCGGGSGVIEDNKQLTEKEIGQKTLHIEGMTCDNCRKRVKNALNKIDGVAAEVNLKKKIAVIHYSREISDEELKNTVENAGYKVK